MGSQNLDFSEQKAVNTVLMRHSIDVKQTSQSLTYIQSHTICASACGRISPNELLQAPVAHLIVEPGGESASLPLVVPAVGPAGRAERAVGEEELYIC